MKHGFLRVHKPIGPTSHDIVGMARKALHERNIGHLGTLDPLASGLMVLAVGTKALKVVELFNTLEKEYVAGMTFGKVSTTYDQAGDLDDVKLKPGRVPPDLLTLRRTIKEQFTGKVMQVPPAHSAIHVDGKRAYELARAGKEVILPEREVQIDVCEILSLDYPHATIRVACSSGTYIRSLIHDLGQVLSCGAYMSSLERRKVGEWVLEGAVTPDKIDWSDIEPLKEVLEHMPKIELVDEEWEDIRHGRSIEREVTGELIAWYDDLPVAMLIADPKKKGFSRPRKVF